jgi:ubiquinone/menaquinone biosynthesis C-methylase UbiE
VADVSANWRRDHPWAAVYDFFVERDYLARPIGWFVFGTDTALLYEALSSIDAVPEGGTILDVPCGGGVALRGLRPDHPVRYVAADIAPTMLARTAAVATERGLEQVETQVADVEQLPFDDGEFDLCLSFAGLHCFPRPDLAVADIARCLRPGGRFVGSLFTTDAGLRYLPHMLAGRAMGMMGPSGSLDDLERWLADAGLTLTDLQRSGAIAYFDAER